MNAKIIIDSAIVSTKCILPAKELAEKACLHSDNLWQVSWLQMYVSSWDNLLFTCNTEKVQPCKGYGKHVDFYLNSG